VQNIGFDLIFGAAQILNIKGVPIEQCICHPLPYIM
jgi:hypothetical protein